MKRLKPIFHLSLAFVPLLAFMSFIACKKDTIKTVAFEATYTTTNELLDPPPLLKQRITGVGQSTALGISKFVAVSTQDQRMPPPFKLNGPCTFYTDNGDVFYTTFSGTSTSNGDGTFTVEMTHTITGGTGIFKHASGSITGKTLADPKKPTGSITSKGSISY